MASVQHAPSSRHELDGATLFKDVRTLGTRIKDSILDPMLCAIVMTVMVGVGIIFPVTADIMIVVLIGFYFYTRQLLRDAALPIRVPKSYGGEDPSDVDQKGKYGQAEGILYLGNEKGTKRELWVSNSDARTHMLVFGTTGSGKTEMLMSLVTNALVQSSGFIYIDGKADTSLFGKMYSLCRTFGREDDLLVVNWMTGARDVRGPQSDKLSNSMNPFSAGSSGMIQQLIVGLISKTGEGGDMWQGRAISFVEGLVKALVYLRDEYGVQLDAVAMTKYFELAELESLIYEAPKKYPGLDDVLGGLKTFVLTLPGYDKKKSPAWQRVNGEAGLRKPGSQNGQGAETLEQFGFITMQLTRIFNSMAYTYGHILSHPLGEVDLYDVIVNRRILVVLLPALEKSGPELANLGKIIVASIKQMMASGLGSKIEGRWKDVINSKPTNAPTPFLCVMDEYGYYAVEGFAVVAAQARGLGFSAIFAGQDVPSFQKAGKEEAESIFANTKFKFCGALEDARDTADLFNRRAGDAHVTRVGGFSKDTDSVTGGVSTNKEISIEKISRISVQDLQDQKAGEFHILWRSYIIRSLVFYANPKEVPYIRPNHFLPVAPPSMEDQEIIEEPRLRIREILVSGADLREVYSAAPLMASDVARRVFSGLEAAPTEEKAAVSIVEFDLARSQHEDGPVAGIGDPTSLDDEDEDFAEREAEMHHGVLPAQGEPHDAGRAVREAAGVIGESDDVQIIPPRQVSVFGDSSVDEYSARVVPAPTDGLEALDQLERQIDAARHTPADDVGVSLRLDAEATRAGIERLEVAGGAQRERAQEVAQSVVRDIEDATRYPRHPQAERSPEQTFQIVDELNEMLGIARRDRDTQ